MPPTVIVLLLLWLTTDKALYADSTIKLQAILDMCTEIGVLTMPALLRVYFGSTSEDADNWGAFNVADSSVFFFTITNDILLPDKDNFYT